MDGGDVAVEEGNSSAAALETNQTPIEKRVVMRISSHRAFVEDVQLNTHNPTLHRVVLATRGQSMVSYTSLVDLLSAAECAAEGTCAIPPADQTLMRSQGLLALNRLGVTHRDVSIGNVFLGTDPEEVAGFISNLNLSSISEEAIKAAGPDNFDGIIEQLKDGERRTVSNYHSNELEYLLMHFLRAGDSTLHGRRSFSGFGVSDFTFQHKSYHDFESLIWVVVYAMMIHHRNTLAATDQAMYGFYKKFWMTVGQFTHMVTCTATRTI